ncbi:MAG: transketolase family protein [Oscillospiraceae bacterium]|nr:transketolase family protein [Oscillospiraceae bacterium]
MAEKIATREAYGNALAEFGEKYEDLVVLDADVSSATKTSIFGKKFPDRFINCGIAEGNMVSVAAGIATTGKIPFASSFAMFAAGRAFEPIRNAIGYPHLNVKIGATHAGMTVGEDGATHQCCEDIGIMRTIPGMTIISPADAVEARAAVEAAILYKGPVYLRFGRLAVPVIFDRETYKFEMGKGMQISEGKDASIIATGIMVGEALKAREILAAEKIDAAVVNMHTIKPIDKDIIIKAAKTGAIVTAEEHNIIGGLGSAVAEVLCENSPCLLGRVGIQDVFGRSGKAEELMKIFGITAEDIAKKVKEILKK